MSIAVLREGTCGSCRWNIDDRGVLTIGPLDGKSGFISADLKKKQCWPWEPCAKEITEVDILPGLYAKGALNGMFYGFRACSVFNVADLDTSMASSFERMFADCTSLSDISGLKDWQTGQVTDMDAMFLGCSSLKDLSPLAGWDTSTVSELSLTFANTPVEDISPLAGWNTQNVRTMRMMFSGCRSLIDITSLAGWDTRKLLTAEGAFFKCVKLADISPLAGWDIRSLKNTARMFTGCAMLKDASPLEKWDPVNLRYMVCMFSGCTSLKKLIDPAAWDIDSKTLTTFMFDSCDPSEIPMVCPREGAFQAWKKCRMGRKAVLVKLMVPADARRLSTEFSRKSMCRADKALVLGIYDMEGKELPEAREAKSLRDRTFVYRKGETVVSEDFDPDVFERSAPGIHFFMDMETAADYMMQ